MNRSELVVTIAGLLGTFLLPWPGAEESDVPRQLASAPAIETACAGVLASPHWDFGRVRTGPKEGIQPTR